MLPLKLTRRTLATLIASALLVVTIVVVLASPKLRSVNLSTSGPNPPTLQPLNSTSPSSKQPKISWSEGQIDITLSPGESLSKSVSFTSSLPLTNIVVEAVPEIASFLTIQPNTFSSVPANQSEPVRVNFSIAATSALGTYEGTIHVRSDSQTFPQTLKVTLQVWQSTMIGNTGLKVSYPPGWNFSLIEMNQIGLTPPDKQVNLDSEYIGDLVIEILPNVSRLNLDDYYKTFASVDLFANSNSYTRMSVNGRTAIKFFGVAGMNTSDIIAIDADQNVIEISDVAQLHELDGIVDLVASSVR
jgi:hypothetical protein